MFLKSITNLPLSSLSLSSLSLSSLSSLSSLVRIGVLALDVLALDLEEIRSSFFLGFSSFSSSLSTPISLSFNKSSSTGTFLNVIEILRVLGIRFPSTLSDLVEVISCVHLYLESPDIMYKELGLTYKLTELVSLLNFIVDPLSIV